MFNDEFDTIFAVEYEYFLIDDEPSMMCLSLMDSCSAVACLILLLMSLIPLLLLLN